MKPRPAPPAPPEDEAPQGCEGDDGTTAAGGGCEDNPEPAAGEAKAATRKCRTRRKPFVL
jgi:hypothetical protein